MNDIIVATGNLGKVAEIRSLLEGRGLGIRVRSMGEVHVKPNIVEDGETFEENAITKALAVAAAAGMPSLADDSGLEVDILGGRPGVHSARYGGEGLDDRGRYQRLLTEMFAAPGPMRTARFRCAIAYVEPGIAPVTFHGTLEGRIAIRPAGASGFGYDPVFVPEGHDRTLAELDAAEKNRISHRARALHSFLRWLEARGET